MASQTAQKQGKSSGSDARGRLDDELGQLRSALLGRMGSAATKLTSRLTDIGDGATNKAGDAKKAAGAKAGEKVAEGSSPVKAALSAGATGIKEGASGLKDKVTQAFGKGGGKHNGKGLKVTNIIEEIDIGAPIDVVYNQWTQFQDFSGFMKKVEGVEQEEDTKLTFKAQVLWSHRQWTGTIIDQVPDKRIVWKSSGEKGRVDGAVTFHELAPELTRVLVVLEYHPQGFFEGTGNLWRAQGRRVRLELKHFRRHVMTQDLLHPEELRGWRGEIHDEEVAVSDEDARERDVGDDEDREDEDREAEDREDDEGYRDEAEDEEPEDDEDEDEEAEDDEAEDDEVDEAKDQADEEDEEADEDEEDDQPEQRRSGGRRQRSAARRR